MGIFGKIKNILFEDDEEFDEMPVYTKEEVKEVPRKEVEVEPAPIVEEPIKTSDNSYFKNVKRDIDLNFDEKDVLGEIPGVSSEIVEPKVEHVEVPQKRVEEKKSIFPSFDEDEFERLNSRINRNEQRARKENRQTVNNNYSQPVANEARRANNNFSATSPSRDIRVDNTDRYKINANPVKKGFTPSPIISPVYGILDKNYTKDDIVDKKGGMKREKVVKPIPKKEEVITIEQAEARIQEETKVVEVDIDSVRKKAYGELSDLEKTLSKIEIPKMAVKEEIKEDIIEKTKIEETKIEESLVEKKTPMVVVEEEEIEIKEAPSIEEQLEDSFTIEEPILEEKTEVELDEVVEKVVENKVQENEKNVTKSNPKMLDDLEKTSTLQILDDIEKELNSIKPISKDVSIIDEDDEIVSKDDTLEKDLFNLIDSMYEEGEEEEEDA